MSANSFSSLDRRTFLKSALVGAASLPALKCNIFTAGDAMDPSQVVLIRTIDRTEGVKTALRLLKFPDMQSKNIVIKPNFNSADDTPGSTHNDTLSQLVREIHERNARSITVAERSGPPDTKEVMEAKGIFDMAEELDFNIINFEELADNDWVHCNPAGNHWDDGYYLPRPVVESEYLVSTCCLKTHGYGGHYTMSMKLAVGLTPKNLMSELHGKSQTYMRAMITELNQGYRPELIVLDGVNAFTDGGPSRGTLKEAGVFIAGTDRVAVDAVGVAVLKDLGSNETIMGRKVFEQDQLKRAVEVGLGVMTPEEITFVTPDDESRQYADKLKGILTEA
ncbi:DUF362 domain-containing protein [candidate division KSB1 bacterium]